MTISVVDTEAQLRNDYPFWGAMRSRTYNAKKCRYDFKFLRNRIPPFTKLNTAIQIREFRYPDDYPPVRDLWASMEKGVRLGSSDTPEEIQKKVARDPDLFLVAEEDGRIIGTVVGGYDGRRGLLYHFAVEASFRGKGIGSRLMDEVEARLRAKGCRRCYLMVLIDNEEARHYYEKHGWENMQHVLTYAKDLA